MSIVNLHKGEHDEEKKRETRQREEKGNTTKRRKGKHDKEKKRETRRREEKGNTTKRRQKRKGKHDEEKKRETRQREEKGNTTKRRKGKHDKEKNRCKSRRAPQRFQAVHLFEWYRSQLGDHLTRFLPLQPQLVCRRRQELTPNVHCKAPADGLYGVLWSLCFLSTVCIVLYG